MPSTTERLPLARWAILGPSAPKNYSELAFMTIQNKKAQVLDSLGLFGLFVWSG